MRIRLLSLNVWGLPLGLAKHQPARMKAISKGLNALDADLICLQEVWTKKARAEFQAAARRGGYPTVWHREANFGGSGLMVLSRIPCRSRNFTSYCLKGLPQRFQHADFYGGKGFVTLNLETETGPLHLINTHLHASYVRPGEDDEYLGVRASQAIQLASALDKLEGPIIAAGDFNTREGTTAYELLLGLADLRDTAAQLDCREPTCTQKHPYRLSDAWDERIDLILLRSGATLSTRPVSIRRVLNETLRFGLEAGSYSDHAGLLAEIELEPTPSPRIAHPPGEAIFVKAESELLSGEERAKERGKLERRWALGVVALGLVLAGVTGSVGSGHSSLLVTTGKALAAVILAGGILIWLGSRRIVYSELAGYGQTREILSRQGTKQADGDRITEP